MNTAHQIINEILSTGSKFTLYGGEFGLTQIVNDDLLERARKNKAQIKQILEAVKCDSRTASPIIWKLKIQSSDGQMINSMTKIDPARMSLNECKEHLDRQFGENRIISFTEITFYIRGY